MFAKNGLGIKLIDKSSGLLVSDRVVNRNNSMEDVNGVILQPTAFLVTNYYKQSKLLQPFPLNVAYDWNVVVTSDGLKTKVNVNIVNIEGAYMTPAGYRLPNGNVAYKTHTLQVKTTGVFEKMIFDAISKK